MLDDGMPGSRRVDDLVVDVRILLRQRIATAADLTLLALFVVYVLLRDDSLPFPEAEVLVVSLVVNGHF